MILDQGGLSKGTIVYPQEYFLFMRDSIENNKRSVIKIQLIVVPI